MVSKKIIYLVLLVLLFVIFGVIISFNRSRPVSVETLNAHVIADTEDVTVGNLGKISNILISQYQDVKKGQVIAEVTVPSPVQKKQVKSKLQPADKKQIEKDYEDAALMYKEGVISQDEYDKSIENIEAKQATDDKEKDVAETKADRVIKVYAPMDGKIVWGNLKVGDTVSKDVVIAKVNSSYKEVLAHFATAYSDNISIGDKAHIKLIKYPEKQFSGVVNSIGQPDKKGLPITIIFEGETSDIDIINGDSAIVKLEKK